MKQIYLDYAAATPMDQEVIDAMQPYFVENFYNPSATYLAGRSAREKLNEARANIARHLGSRPAEIIFTAGATEANNLAIQGVMKNHPDCKVLVSAIEHESVLAPAKLFDHQEIPVSSQGIVELSALEKMIDDKTVLVSIMYVNNELGSIQPLADVAQILNKLRNMRAKAGNKTPLYFHTDAAQAGNFFDLHVSRLGVDLLSINGGKIYGPKQSGALYVKAGVQLQPLTIGGGQEFGLRSGTENLAAAAAIAKALELAQERRQTESKRLLGLRREFEQDLLNEFKKASINGGNHRGPHIVSVSFEGTDNERLMMQLDEAGIVCAVGSACSASRDEASHVLSAIGLSEDQARSTLRFSLGRQTTQQQLSKAVETLRQLLPR